MTDAPEKPTAEPETVPPIDAGAAPLELESADLLRAQVDLLRERFYRLAQIRGAELVIYQGKSFFEAQNYADTELQQLDRDLAAVQA